MDLLIRLPATGVLLLLALLLITEHPKHRLQWLLVALIATMAMFLVSTSSLFPDPESILRLALRLLDAPNLILLWLTLRRLFDDRSLLPSAEWTIGIAYTLLMLGERLVEAGILQSPTWFEPLIMLCSGVLVTHLVVVVWQGRSDDLLTQRRQLRLLFSSTVAIAAAVSVILGNTLPAVGVGSTHDINAIVIALVAFIAGYSLLRPASGRLYFESPPESLSTLSSLSSVSEPAVLTPRERQLSNVLERHMIGQKGYLKSDLTIAGLASELAVGEHLLRPLINKKLRFRNFSDYLNSLRIAHAKAAFLDPQQNHIPILSIALGSGYNSITAFNRAFRQQEGCTPSVFRTRAQKRIENS